METTQPITKTSRTIAAILLIALITALSSEFKILPFEDAPFRFGLGSIAFFFALLIRPLPVLLTGIITGIIVVVFRAFLSFIYSDALFTEQLLHHFPAALFYIVFAACLNNIAIHQIKAQPFLLVFYGIVFEVLANTSEQLASSIFVTGIWPEPETFLLFIAVGFLRSFFVIGLYSTITFSEQKKQIQQLLSINANLYVETLYLQKSMNQVEQLTADSFQLYKQLKPYDRIISNEALRISQEIHEIKKDHQRIYAGLSKITSTDRADTFLLSDLLIFVVEANENYARSQDKHIDFSLVCPVDLKTDEHIALLAVLNNLMANAVEAIEQLGSVSLHVKSTEQHTIFTVEDNGVGIEPSILSIIFDAGYTSKYSTTGIASTGIGLSHVQAIMTRLSGTIEVTSEKTTIFTVTIPTKQLRKKELFN